MRTQGTWKDCPGNPARLGMVVSPLLLVQSVDETANNDTNLTNISSMLQRGDIGKRVEL
jgi:hypothetical protein